MFNGETVVYWLLQVLEYALGFGAAFPEMTVKGGEMRKKVGFWAVVLVTGGLYAYNGILSVMSVPLVLLFPLMCFPVFLLLGRRQAQRAVCWMFVFLATVSVLKLLVVMMVGILEKSGVQEINTNPQFEIQIPFEIIMNGILAILLWCRRKGSFLEIRDSKRLLWFELGFGILEAAVMCTIMRIGQYGIPDWLMLTNFCIALLLLSCLVFFLIYEILQRTKRQYLMMEMRGQMLEEQIQQMKQVYEHFSKENHEKNRERQYLLACLRNGEIQKAQIALEKKTGAQQDQKKIWTGNPLLDFLINICVKEMEEKEIEFRFSCDLHMLSVSEEDTCVLLGNLLDNAIEAASLCPVERRWIRLNLQMQGQMFVLSLSNASSRLPKRKGERFLSSKDGPTHGWGLENVQELVRKYDGIVDFVYDEQQFEVKFLLQEAHAQET